MRVVENFRKPTRFDKEPYKTVWKYTLEEGGQSLYYLQASKQQAKPFWMHIAYLLEQMAESQILNNPEFIDQLCPDEVVFTDESDEGSA